MTIRRTTTKRRNNRRGGGPRTATGKAIASRNALRHGLAAITHRQFALPAEIERLAKAMCGPDDDPRTLAQAAKIAACELEFQAIRTEQVAAVERLREPYAVPFGKRDNSVQLGLARSMESWVADRELAARLPAVLKAHKHEMPPKEPPTDDDLPGFLVPLRLVALIEGPDEPTPEALEQAKKLIEERDEYQALQAAILDLLVLDRYERRAWSRQKCAIRLFTTLRILRAKYVRQRRRMRH
jgi:hypothetical protein